jgi:hypothetical protein
LNQYKLLKGIRFSVLVDTIHLVGFNRTLGISRCGVERSLVALRVVADEWFADGGLNVVDAIYDAELLNNSRQSARAVYLLREDEVLRTWRCVGEAEMGRRKTRLIW